MREREMREREKNGITETDERKTKAKGEMVKDGWMEGERRRERTAPEEEGLSMWPSERTT